jgi:hypothetical protein
MVEPRRFIRSDIAASVFGHLSALAMVLIFAEVHPFGSVTAEPITVDLVSPAEAPPPAKKEEPAPPQQAVAADSPDAKPAALNSPPPAAPPPAAAQPQKQAALSTLRPNRQQAATQPQPPRQPQPQAPASSPGYIPPEPDLSVKYHVMLGLPQPLPPIKSGGDEFDAPASKQADIASNLVTEFRRHLKTCSKLPQSIEPSDSIKVKLRVFMMPDGTLAREPILIEASASAKGPILMEGAINALQACAPYAMLPADRYGEWKVLELSFTPRDFSGG